MDFFETQCRNRPSSWKVAVSFKIIMTTSVTRPCFTTQHQTCKTNTKTKTDYLVPDRSCPKTVDLRPHHCYIWQRMFSIRTAANTALQNCIKNPAVADKTRDAFAQTTFDRVTVKWSLRLVPIEHISTYFLVLSKLGQDLWSALLKLAENSKGF